MPQAAFDTSVSKRGPIRGYEMSQPMGRMGISFTVTALPANDSLLVRESVMDLKAKKCNLAWGAGYNTAQVRVFYEAESDEDSPARAKDVRVAGARVHTHANMSPPRIGVTPSVAACISLDLASTRTLISPPAGIIPKIDVCMAPQTVPCSSCSRC